MIPPVKELLGILYEEQRCIQYLIEKGVLLSPLQCEQCGGEMRQASKILFRCRKKSCQAGKSLLSNSFFAGSRLRCNEILHIGYLWLCKVPSASMQIITGHSTHTISDFRRFYMQLVAETLDDEDMTIGGEGIVVQIDETKLGKRKYHRGHRVDGVWVLVGVEKTEQRRVFVESVQSRDAETLREVISRHVAPGSIIHTDMWRGYLGLESLGYEHQTVNHSENFRDPETGVNTNTVEGTNNALKISVPSRNRTTDFIDEHLTTFIWRRKNSHELWIAFLRALRDVGYPEND